MESFKFRVYSEKFKGYVKGGDGVYILIDCGDNRINTLVSFNGDILEPYIGIKEIDEDRAVGREIFQGDIVEVDLFENHEKYRVEITDYRRIPDDLIGSKVNSRKIVGNIHEEE